MPSPLLNSHVLAPALEANIRSTAQQLHVNMVIDAALIDAVISEELDTERKAQEAVRKGKEQLAARS